MNEDNSTQYQDDSVQLSQRQIDARSGLNISYHGQGGEFFKIHIVNILLTVVTLGLYYPWAKAKLLQYHYAETELKGSRFTFHGTGKEMFVGMLKALVLFGVLYGVLFVAIKFYPQNPTIIISAALLFYLGILLIMPIAIVGSVRYRASRSSWRGIHFQYVGNLTSMYKVFGMGVLYTILTFGIYGVWFGNNIRKEVLDNLKWGNVKFSFTGDGGSLFGIHIVGYLLSYITIGIYFFKYQSNVFNFNIDNMKMDQGGNTGGFKASTTGMGLFKVLIGNLFIIVFTLGLAMPYAMVRYMKYIVSNIKIMGFVDLDNLEQGELEETNAVGEGLLDALDMDIIF